MKGLNSESQPTIQSQIANSVCNKYQDAVVKKVDQDNYLDIHLPSVNEKRGTHLGVNTGKNVIRMVFYCRDEDFVQDALGKSNNLEEYSKGIRPKGDPTFTSIHEAIEAIFKFVDELENIRSGNSQASRNKQETLDINDFLEKSSVDIKEEEDVVSNELEVETSEEDEDSSLSEDEQFTEILEKYGIDEIDELTTITTAEAKKLAKYNGFLFLDNLTFISDEVAEAFSTHEGDLSLDGLTTISDKAISFLANLKGDLFLNGLTSLPESGAKSLSKHVGGLYLNKVTYLNDSDLEILSLHDGSLFIDGLTNISESSIIKLASIKGTLSIDGITALSDRAAAALSNHIGDLYLNGLTTLSDVSVAYLVKHQGSLYLDGLTTLSENASKILSSIGITIKEQTESDDDNEEDYDEEEDEEDSEETEDESEVEFEDVVTTKYTFIDNKGNLLSEYGYDSADWFVDGFARVGNNGEFFYINKKNEKVVFSDNVDVLSFTGKLFRISKDGLYGFANTSGKTIIPCKYEDADDFNNGFAKVVLSGKTGYVSESGIEVIPCKYDDGQSDFGDGFVLVELGDKSIVINSNGEEIWTLDENDEWGSFNFSFGLASVLKDGKYGYIDLSGNIQIPFIFDVANDFYNDCAIVSSADKRFLIDQKGKAITELDYLSVDFFSEGLCLVQSITGLYGYIDEKGIEVIPCQFEEAFFFENGCAQVEMGESKKMINRSGEICFDLEVDFIVGFSEGFFLVRFENFTFQFIGLDGKPLISEFFEDAKQFDCGLAVVKKDGEWGVIDIEGKQVIPFNYSVVSHFADGFFLVGYEVFVTREKFNGKIIVNSNPISDYTDDVKVKEIIAIDPNQIFIVNYIESLGEEFIKEVQQNSKSPEEFEPTLFYVNAPCEFVLGYDGNTYLSESVAGVLSDELIIELFDSEQEWSDFIWDNDWYNVDSLYHEYGIGEPATDLELPDGERISISLKYTNPDYDIFESCFKRTNAGDFIQIASSEEKGYGWDDWKRYSIQFQGGVFNLNKVKVEFEGLIVSGYSLEGKRFSESDDYSTTGKGFTSTLYFNNGKKLVEVEVEELKNELVNAGVDLDNVDEIKAFLLKNKK